MIALTAPKPQDEDDDAAPDDVEGADSDDDEEEVKDWSDLEAKADHAARPLYVGKNKHAFLERFSPFFKYAEEDPFSREAGS